VGNGNINVDNPARNSGQPDKSLAGNTVGLGQRIDSPVPQKLDRMASCGAMSQQYGDGARGNESAPQKFVHLVGYRDPHAQRELRARPHPVPQKR
jgi:hypothetical protein